jgi:DNA-binding NarL/FixJ family response regulator
VIAVPACFPHNALVLKVMPRILIADDHAMVRRFVREALEEQGWNVCGEAATGKEAVAMTAEQKPDLVVLDLSMPEMDSLRAAQEIHTGQPQIAMIVLTMHESPELRREALSKGVRTCVLKSDIRHLIGAIQDAIEGKPTGRHDASCDSDRCDRPAPDRETKGREVQAGAGTEEDRRFKGPPSNIATSG